MEHKIADSDEFLPQAPLTGGKKEPSEPKHKFYGTHGRRVIRVPLSDKTLNEVTIQKYLPHILAVHAENATECMHFRDVYRNKMDILYKERPYGSEDKSNAIVIENHINYMIEFKKGYMYGNPVKYSINDEATSTDELTYLNRYMKDQMKSNKDIDLAEDIFKCGNAYRIILPKDYPVNNLEKESPFVIYNLDNLTTFVVYSSDFRRKKIMGGIITELDSTEPSKKEFEVMIYTRAYTYKYRCYSTLPTWEKLDFKGKKVNPLGKIPIFEYYTNNARMGICDLAESMNNAINSMSSDTVDAINDFVNSILLLENSTIDKETKKAVEELGTLMLQTNDPSRPAKASYLINQLNQADVITRYETMLKWMYSIVGVPQPTQKSTSGGDTGEARELGGGWENANIVANQNEEPLKQGDMKGLDIALTICSMTPKCPVNTLYKSDIEINFNRTRSNNILTKTQALQNLISINVPKEIALNMVGITGNSHEVAMAWEELDAKLKEEAKQNQEKQKQEGDNSPSTEEQNDKE